MLFLKYWPTGSEFSSDPSRLDNSIIHCGDSFFNMFTHGWLKFEFFDETRFPNYFQSETKIMLILKAKSDKHGCPFHFRMMQKTEYHFDLHCVYSTTIQFYWRCRKNKTTRNQPWRHISNSSGDLPAVQRNTCASFFGHVSTFRCSVRFSSEQVKKLFVRLCEEMFSEVVKKKWKSIVEAWQPHRDLKRFQ